MQECRDIEDKYPPIPNHWHKCHQYSIAPRVMQAMKNAWTFGIGKDARHEGWIRHFNSDVEIQCFDPTRMSKRTIKFENKTIKWRDLDKGWEGKPILHWHNWAYHPSASKLEFYTNDTQRRCYSLVNHNPKHVVHQYRVRTNNIAGYLADFPTPDYIKFDVEGLWYDFCKEVVNNNLPVKQVVGEFEMYMGNKDTEFLRLNTVIQLFEDAGYMVFTNRRLTTDMVELAFVKKEYV